MSIDETESLEDLLPDDLRDGSNSAGADVPEPTPAEKAAVTRREKNDLAGESPAVGKQGAKQQAAQLAQVINLHIAGYSLADIGNAIGATSDEVDRMLQQDTSRYVRSQPALRTYVRNWVSERYSRLLEAVWDDATDVNASSKLESQDRALRILDRMTKLHGAEAPAQSEVKVDAAPEAVEKMVSALSAQQGMGYDTSIFDTVDAEVVHDAVEQSTEAVEVSGNAVGDPQEQDPEEGF